MLGQYNTRLFDQNYGISQSFNPFLWKAKAALLNENARQAELQQDAAKQEIVFQIRQSWNIMLYHQAQNEAIIREDSLMQRFIKAANLRYKTGETGALESQMANAKQQELQQQLQQNQYFIQIEKNKVLAFLNKNDDFTIIERAFLLLENAFLNTVDVLEKNPSLQIAQQAIKNATAEHALQQAELKPEFTAGYFVQSLTGNQEVEGKMVYYDAVPRFQGVTLGVAVPIFGKAANTAKMQAAETNILLQQKKAEVQKATLQSLFTQELQQLDAHKAQLLYYKNSALPNAQLITKTATKAYTNGDISYIEYLQSLQTARDIQRSYRAVIFKHNESIINIQFLLNQ